MKFEYEPVINESKVNQFELIITHMHGDADVYTESNHYFRITDDEGEDVVKPTIAFLKQLQHMSNCELRQLINDGSDQDLLEWDNQYLDQVAVIDDFELYFYNINGTKFKVKLVNEEGVENLG